MLSFKITDVKGFMSNLLIKPMFDSFLVSEVTIAVSQTVHIAGTLNKDFYTEEEWESFNGRKNVKWSEIKPFCYQLVKGQKTPLGFKIVLLLPSGQVKTLIRDGQLEQEEENIHGLFLIMKYEKNELSLITGTSLKVFTLDKTLEREWDEWIRSFLKQHDIAWE